MTFSLTRPGLSAVSPCSVVRDLLEAYVRGT